MIVELAIIEIKQGSNADFEQNLDKARHVISQAKGYLGHEFKHCIEQENRYILLIHWETLADHTEGFRGSELFKEWRALISPFFENPPLVQHFGNLF